jgi:hypothetical protein
MAAPTSEMNTSFSFLQIRMVLLRAVPDVSHRHFTTEPLPHVITGKGPWFWLRRPLGKEPILLVGHPKFRNSWRKYCYPWLAAQAARHSIGWV